MEFGYDYQGKAGQVDWIHRSEILCGPFHVGVHCLAVFLAHESRRDNYDCLIYMRLKRTYILLLVLSVVAAASIFVMLAYHFREGARTSKKAATKMDVLKYKNNPITKLEFDYKDTLYGSKYYKDGTVIINDVLIPGPGAFDPNKDDTTDTLYATVKSTTFIMKNVPTDIMEKKRNNMNMLHMAETYTGETYCVKCKQKRDFEGTVKVSDSGRRMAQGICPVCGTKVNRILGKAQ